MKKWQKLLPLILALCILFTACNSSPTEYEKEAILQTETVRSETTSLDLLPTTDFDAYGFHILAYNNAYMEHRAEEITGEVLNDAVYTRNIYVEDRYNIDINVTDMDHDTYVSTLQNNIQANEDAVDLYQIFLSYAAGNPVRSGYFMDWNDIPYVSDNMNQAWWSQLGIEQLQICGKNYLLNGDIGHMTLSCTQAILFNKDLLTDLGIPYPYTDVLNGTWTLDKLLSLCDGQDIDLNGDGALTAENDQFGFMTTKWIAPVGIAIGCDLETLRYTAEGYPELNLMTEKMLDVFNKAYKLICTSGLELDDYHMVSLDTIPYRTFWENRALFTAATIGIMTDLRDMENSFGVLPNPKYDIEQEHYISCVDAGTTTAAIAVTATDIERTGLIVEALCEKGSETVIPAFYNTVLQNKASRDEESLTMLDIIRESACIDPLYVYDFGGMGFLIQKAITNKDPNISSQYAAKEAAALTSINTFWEDFQ